MTWTLKPGLYRTRDGSWAEVFAERDGMFYGRVGICPSKWDCNGDNFGSDRLDILPPEPVKKWRWVMRRAQTNRFPSAYEYYETIKRYATAREADMDLLDSWEAIARIEGSEVTE